MERYMQISGGVLQDGGDAFQGARAAAALEGLALVSALPLGGSD